MLKVGVIGAGSMGRHHVRVYSELDNCRLVGVSDPNAEKAALAQQYGAQFFNDYRALLEQGLDLVTIAAPTSLHFQIACDALDAGANLLVEKPITDSLETAVDLIARGKAAGKSIAVGHIERFNPAVGELKALIGAGELGEVLDLHAQRVGPYHGRIMDTGIVLDLGTHDVDLTSYLFNSRAETVFATAMQRQHNHEDHAMLQLAFPESRVATIETSWLAPFRSRGVRVFGTKRFAFCDLMNQRVELYEANPDGPIPFTKEHPIPAGEPLMRELESVVGSLLNGTEPVSTAEDSAYALRVCLSALKSIETCKAVTVSEL
jgi:UDP-N-acetylglucosamine 3-dehydrogenase